MTWAGQAGGPDVPAAGGDLESGPPPIAARVAVSVRRAVARTNCSPATLTHAMSSTHATAASRIISA